MEKFTCKLAQRTQQLLGALSNCFLEQLILAPTSKKAAILDFIFCNTQGLVQEVTIAEPLSNRVHNIIKYNTLGRGSGQRDTQVTRDFRKAFTS